MLPDFDDLDVFFDTDAFAEEVLVGPEWQEETMEGTFSNIYKSLDQNVSSTQPNLLVRDSDVQKFCIVKGTRVVVDEEAYSVYDVQPDSPGVSRLFLNKERRK